MKNSIVEIADRLANSFFTTGETVIVKTENLPFGIFAYNISIGDNIIHKGRCGAKGQRKNEIKTILQEVDSRILAKFT